MLLGVSTGAMPDIPSSNVAVMLMFSATAAIEALNSSGLKSARLPFTVTSAIRKLSAGRIMISAASPSSNSLLSVFCPLMVALPRELSYSTDMVKRSPVVVLLKFFHTLASVYAFLDPAGTKREAVLYIFESKILSLVHTGGVTACEMISERVSHFSNAEKPILVIVAGNSTVLSVPRTTDISVAVLEAHVAERFVIVKGCVANCIDRVCLAFIVDSSRN